MYKVIRSVRVYGLIIAAVSLVLFEIFAAPVVRLFLTTTMATYDDAVKTLGYAALFLQIRCLASIAQFLNYHTSFCMQAVGNGRDTLIHSFCRELVFYIPFMYLLNAIFGKVGLVCALIAGETCGAILALILFARWKRKTMKN